MATSPKFTDTPVLASVHVAAANLASDGSGTLVTLFTVPTGGMLLQSVTAINAQATQAASSAMLIKIFASDTGGANPRAIEEFTLAAATRAATVLGATATKTMNYTAKAGQIIYVTQSIYAGVADQNSITLRGGEFN